MSFEKDQYNIETKRLILRKLINDDAFEMFSSWASDEDVAKYMTWNPHKNIEETKMILSMWVKEYENPKTLRYGITLKHTNQLIGSIDVVGYRFDCPVIGYCLSKEHWNNGYMSEALSSLIERIFSLGYKKILIEADENNIGSNRVIQKCGFKFIRKETKQNSRLKPYMITVNWYELVKQ